MLNFPPRGANCLLLSAAIPRLSGKERARISSTLCGSEDGHNSANLVIAKVHGVLPVRGELPRGEVDLEAVVSPCSELERTVLLVERKPRDVNLARRLENPLAGFISWIYVAVLWTLQVLCQKNRLDNTI